MCFQADFHSYLCVFLQTLEILLKSSVSLFVDVLGLYSYYLTEPESRHNAGLTMSGTMQRVMPESAQVIFIVFYEASISIPTTVENGLTV